jgi:M6 family metalloprotease-like protein
MCSKHSTGKISYKLFFKKNFRGLFSVGRILFFAVMSGFFSTSAFCAPYLGKEIEFQQPDGNLVAVRVWGDEFYIHAETLDGYPLVRDPANGFVCYALVDKDESDFISTGIPYTGQSVDELKTLGRWPSLRGEGITKGRRLKNQVVIEKADQNRRLLGRDRQGRILLTPGSGFLPTGDVQLESSGPLIGNIVGLTLLIQFPDVPATIPQADIDNYCNQVGYTDYGNNGSIRDYFYDVSNGKLIYTNYVTAYYTARYNRAYYTDETVTYGRFARELIDEALEWLDDPAGLNFDFGILSTDSYSCLLAINAFYAGPTVNAWSKGLWPHMSTMYGEFTSNEGVQSGVYQITNIGSSLALGTFCHENGHMICGYPDLYDYGFESYGVGDYCLMGYGGSGFNPVPPNPYLRNIKGWEISTVFPSLSGVKYFIQSNSNISYKYRNPANSNELFFIDSRTKNGRNSSLPDEGLMIWHIDKIASNDNEQMTPSRHYLVSVEQADGQFHLEYHDSYGESGDLFHAGYKDIFNDTSSPNANWWDGSNSNLVIRQISGVGSTMSFIYGNGPLIGDIDGDGDVDLADLSVLTDQWLEPPGSPSADIAPQPSGDGVVNLDDFAIMAAHWLTGT